MQYIFQYLDPCRWIVRMHEMYPYDNIKKERQCKTQAESVTSQSPRCNERHCNINGRRCFSFVLCTLYSIILFSRFQQREGTERENIIWWLRTLKDRRGRRWKKDPLVNLARKCFLWASKWETSFITFVIVSLRFCYTLLHLQVGNYMKRFWRRKKRASIDLVFSFPFMRCKIEPQIYEVLVNTATSTPTTTTTTIAPTTTATARHWPPAPTSNSLLNQENLAAVDELGICVNY